MADRPKSRPGRPRTREERASPNQQAGIPKPPKIILGDPLEYRIARLQIFMGFYVRRGCPIYTIGGLDQATDLDVLAIRYIEPFRRQMLITECKGGDDGPLDRIFWLSGLKNFIGTHEAFLVRKTTRWNIKDFAKKADVQILDYSRIEELEATYRISETDWPGICDRGFVAARIDDWNRALYANIGWWDLYWTILSEVRYGEPFAGVNYLMQHLRLLTRSTSKAMPIESLQRKIITEAIAQLALFLMQIVETSYDLSAKDRRGFIVKGLTYGGLDSRSAERVLNSAYNLTHQAILHYTNKNLEVDRTLFQMPVPPGTDEVIAMVELIMNNHPASLTITQICDLVLWEEFVKNKEASVLLPKIFPGSDLKRRLELAASFLGFLVKAGACPQEALDAVVRTLSEYSSKVGGATIMDEQPDATAPLKSSTSKPESVPSTLDQPEDFRLEPPP